MGSGNARYSSVTVTQINLQHSKAATALLSKRLSMLHTTPHITTIQEPWVHKGRICGLGEVKGAKMLYDETSSRPRVCLIASPHFELTNLAQFCGQDLVAVRVCFESSQGWENFVVASSYFPYDSLLPAPP